MPSKSSSNPSGKGARRACVGVGLLGLGVVGSGVARILQEKAPNYAAQIDCPLRLVSVLVRDLEKPRRVDVNRSLLTTDPAAVVENDDVDVVIEVMGGESPAFEYVRQALAAGKYVVTANKELIAKHGPELRAIAERNGVDILFEASVGGGIPIIAPLKRDLLANDIQAISAIINGTTNYILTRMAGEGLDFDSALRQAQDLGYAEPDPSNDVEGTDAAYKLAILASLAFRASVHPDQVYREGITRLSARDFRYARELGYVIKLLAVARKVDATSLQARVHPVLLAEDEELAKVDGVLNAVQVEGDLLGRALFQGRGAGAFPTTSAVVADVLDAAVRVVSGGRWQPSFVASESLVVQDVNLLRTRYYMRITVADRPGVLASITKVFGDHEISIASIIQKEADEKAQTAEIVIMTHEAQEAAVQDALRRLAALPEVAEVGNLLRVEG